MISIYRPTADPRDLFKRIISITQGNEQAQLIALFHRESAWHNF